MRRRERGRATPQKDAASNSARFPSFPRRNRCISERDLLRARSFKIGSGRVRGRDGRRGGGFLYEKGFCRWRRCAEWTWTGMRECALSIPAFSRSQTDVNSPSIHPQSTLNPTWIRPGSRRAWARRPQINLIVNVVTGGGGLQGRMASGYGATGGRGRCFPFIEDFERCMAVVRTERERERGREGEGERERGGEREGGR